MHLKRSGSRSSRRSDWTGPSATGLKIYTTIDARVQQQAEEALRAQLDEVERNPAFQNHQTYAQYSAQFHDEEKKLAQQAPPSDSDAQQPSIHSVVANPEYLQGALIAINNSDGGVIALVGGSGLQAQRVSNRAMNARARRPAGTAFTPFVYAAAYQKRDFPRVVCFSIRCSTTGRSWSAVRTASWVNGASNVPAIATTARSRRVWRWSKGKKRRHRARRQRGPAWILFWPWPNARGSPRLCANFPATFLGSSEVNLSELALAYTGFPNGGWRPAAPYILSEIKDADGTVLFQAKPGPRVRIIDVGPAYQVHNELAQILKTGSGSTASSRYGLKPMAAGGKPGTAYNFTDALFCRV